MDFLTIRRDWKVKSGTIPHTDTKRDRYSYTSTIMSLSISTNTVTEVRPKL
ncbi:hypothetical protein [Fischerella thermalis]|uniref:hypothetical protein n=1 Tax=Fischerella thermalis TaxID=372787 RepID=UPI001559CD12|nr:hypothetical protein [Fischerella thermalis]